MTVWVFVFPVLIAVCAVVAGGLASLWSKGEKL